MEFFSPLKKKIILISCGLGGGVFLLRGLGLSKGGAKLTLLFLIIAAVVGVVAYNFFKAYQEENQSEVEDKSVETASESPSSRFYDR